MMVFGLHIIYVGMVSAIVGTIAYRMGKKEGIRITKMYIEEQQQGSQESNNPS